MPIIHGGRPIVIPQDKLRNTDDPTVREYPGSVPRPEADADWRAQLARNRRQDREAVGIPKALDGTPWVGRGRGRR